MSYSNERAISPIIDLGFETIKQGLTWFSSNLVVFSIFLCHIKYVRKDFTKIGSSRI